MMKYQVVSAFGNFALFDEPVSLEVALSIYRIMIAPPFIDSQLSFYIRAVEVTV